METHDEQMPVTRGIEIKSGYVRFFGYLDTGLSEWAKVQAHRLYDFHADPITVHGVAGRVLSSPSLVQQDSRAGSQGGQ